MASMSAAERTLHFFARPLMHCFYRVTAFGREHLPKGGFLLLPNHITWVDAIVLQLACPRPIRYVIDEEFYRKRLLHPFLRAVGCIPINIRHSRSAIRAAAQQIAAGEIVCLFPEGQLERAGTLLRLQRGYELIARHANAAVVPVWHDQLWGSIFSFQGGRFFSKLPKRIPYHVTIAFGKPLKPEDADIATVREELLKLGEFCYSRRPAVDRHLAEECVRGLKRRPFATAVIDGLDHSVLSRSKLLGAAAALSRFLRKEFRDERVAIVLPASKGSMLANLAVTLAGKVPVDLNFTIGRAANESCCKRANLRVDLSRFRKELMRNERETLGRYDSRYMGVDPDAAGESPEYDASDTAISGAFISTLNTYLSRDLGYTTNMAYRASASEEEGFKWDWSHKAPGFNRPLQSPNTAIDLAAAMRTNPYLKVLSLNGWYDMATPFFGTEYDLNHMMLEPAQQRNLEFRYYPSGHMVYLNPDALHRMRLDVERFIYDAVGEAQAGAPYGAPHRRR